MKYQKPRVYWFTDCRYIPLDNKQDHIKERIVNRVTCYRVTIFKKSYVDGISFSGMEERFTRFESILPDLEEITKEQADMANKIMAAHRSTLNDLGL